MMASGDNAHWFTPVVSSISPLSTPVQLPPVSSHPLPLPSLLNAQLDIHSHAFEPPFFTSQVVLPGTSNASGSAILHSDCPPCSATYTQARAPLPRRATVSLASHHYKRLHCQAGDRAWEGLPSFNEHDNLCPPTLHAAHTLLAAWASLGDGSRNSTISARPETNPAHYEQPQCNSQSSPVLPLTKPHDYHAQSAFENDGASNNFFLEGQHVEELDLNIHGSQPTNWVRPVSPGLAQGFGGMIYNSPARQPSLQTATRLTQADFVSPCSNPKPPPGYLNPRVAEGRLTESYASVYHGLQDFPSQAPQEQRRESEPIAAPLDSQRAWEKRGRHSIASIPCGISDPNNFTALGLNSGFSLELRNNVESIQKGPSRIFSSFSTIGSQPTSAGAPTAATSVFEDEFSELWPGPQLQENYHQSQRFFQARGNSIPSSSCPTSYQDCAIPGTLEPARRSELLGASQISGQLGYVSGQLRQLGTCREAGLGLESVLTQPLWATNYGAQENQENSHGCSASIGALTGAPTYRNHLGALTEKAETQDAPRRHRAKTEANCRNSIPLFPPLCAFIQAPSESQGQKRARSLSAGGPSYLVSYRSSEELPRFGGLGQGPSPYPPGLEVGKKPPDEDFASSVDRDMLPWKQKLRCDEDLYTPMWCRGEKDKKEGFCDMCEKKDEVRTKSKDEENDSAWFKLKNSAYWYHKQYYHGISSITGHYFFPPLQTKPGFSTVGRQQIIGLCHECKEWVPYSSLSGNKHFGGGGAGEPGGSKRRRTSNSSRRKRFIEKSTAEETRKKEDEAGEVVTLTPTLWYKHAQKCHQHKTCKGSKGKKKIRLPVESQENTDAGVPVGTETRTDTLSGPVADGNSSASPDYQGGNGIGVCEKT